MKPFRWNRAENESLVAERGISFESIVVAIDSGGLLDILAHPNRSRYPGQKILVVIIDRYAFLVPYIEETHHLFLKTIIPSRKATRDYLNEGGQDDQG